MCLIGKNGRRFRFIVGHIHLTVGRINIQNRSGIGFDFRLRRRPILGRIVRGIGSSTIKHADIIALARLIGIGSNCPSKRITCRGSLNGRFLS